MKRWINRALCILVGMALSPSPSNAQFTRFLIEFTDKHQGNYTLQNPSAYLSGRAIERRNRFSVSLDSTDLPVSAYYLDSISRIPGVQVHSSSKWLNKVLVSINDQSVLSQLQIISFIRSNAPIALRRVPGMNNEVLNKFREQTFPIPSGERISGVRRQMGEEEFFNWHQGLILLFDLVGSQP